MSFPLAMRAGLEHLTGEHVILYGSEDHFPVLRQVTDVENTSYCSSCPSSQRTVKVEVKVVPSDMHDADI